uniref:CCR4-NOT transcription complex subunit 1 HEAT repeat domain-containing protein n=1 Tax=Plectus sambesii TaxID=2011161 RepID=A0A914VM91_9BILA
MNALRQELLQLMMPVFLGNHPNAMVVLNYAWNSTLHNQHALRNTILNAMASFYLKNPEDQ